MKRINEGIYKLRTNKGMSQHQKKITGKGHDQKTFDTEVATIRRK